MHLKIYDGPDRLDLPTALLFAIMPMIIGLLFLAHALIYGPFDVGWRLYVRYFGYAAVWIVIVHTLIFLLNYHLRKRESKIRKKVPKYIEYAYAVLLSISLVQIFFSSSRISDYLTLSLGNERQQWDDVRARAKRHVAEDCSRRSYYFPEDYCKKMLGLADAYDIKGHAFNELIPDKAFLSHVIGKAGPADTYSPVGAMIERLYSKEVYEHLPRDQAAGGAFAWIAILLLPVGIALRLAKTSLELFGDLDSETALPAS